MATNNAINSNTVTPAFLAYPSANILNVTGDGTLYNTVWNTEKFDISSDYDIATGLFTARYNGVYLFSYSLYPDTIGSKSLIQTFLTTPSVSYMLFNGYGAFTGPAGIAGAFSSAVSVYMTAGETAKIQFKVTGGTKNSDITQLGAAELGSYFGGYLIYKV